MAIDLQEVAREAHVWGMWRAIFLYVELLRARGGREDYLLRFFTERGADIAENIAAAHRPEGMRC